MAGGCGSGIGTMPRKRSVYTMRHGQKKFGSDDPSLTDRGCEQVAEAVKKYLSAINFDLFRCGSSLRHLQSAGIAKNILGDFRLYCFGTTLLSLTNEMDEAANRCVIAGLEHPKGFAIGFRIDTWFETDPTLMRSCAQQLQKFFQKIPENTKSVLAISSCPIIESAVLQPKKTRLLGDCGIIKYVIDDAGAVVSSEIIFEGFFEKPPQKNP